MTSAYGSYRTMTAWQSTTAWRARFKSMREDFESRVSDAGTSLGTAWSDQISGAGDLAAKKALARIQAATKAKLAAQQKSTPIVDAPKSSAFSYNSQLTLGSGSNLNLDAGTLTLSDGTTIDLKTGLKTKAVDITA